MDGQSEVLPQQQPPATTPAPAKVPPPPLFPRHRRGLYLNGLGLWVIDATPQSPPLETDDPGVPDKGVYEINLTTDADVSPGRRTFDLLFVDANYGVLPHVLGHELPTQLKFEVPLSATKDSGQPFTTGLGPTKIGVKFNFYSDEDRGVGMSFYPQVEFTTESRSVRDGLADAGQTLIFPLLASKELKYVTLVFNGTVNTPIHDPDRHPTGALSFGLGVAVTRKFAVMAELRGESRFDLAHDRLLIVNVGLMRAVGQKTELYANVGHSLFSDDGLSHAYAGAGLKLLIKPDVTKPR